MITKSLSTKLISGHVLPLIDQQRQMQQFFISFMVVWSCTCFTLNTAVVTFGDSAPANSKQANLPISSNSYRSYPKIGNDRRVRKCNFSKRKSSKKKINEKMLDRHEDLEAIKRLIAIGKKQRSVNEPVDWTWMRNRESGEQKILSKLKRTVRVIKAKSNSSGSHRNAAKKASKVKRHRRNRVSGSKHKGAIATVSKSMGHQINKDSARVENEMKTLKSNQNAEDDLKSADSIERNSKIGEWSKLIQNDDSSNSTMPVHYALLQHGGSKGRLQNGKSQSGLEASINSKHVKLEGQHLQGHEFSPNIQDGNTTDLEKQSRSHSDQQPNRSQVASDISIVDPENIQKTICPADEQSKINKKILSQEKKFVVTNFRKYVMNFLCPHCGGEISVSRGRTKGLFNVKDDVRVHKSDADMIKPSADSSWPPKDQKSKEEKK